MNSTFPSTTYSTNLITEAIYIHKGFSASQKNRNVFPPQNENVDSFWKASVFDLLKMGFSQILFSQLCRLFPCKNNAGLFTQCGEWSLLLCCGISSIKLIFFFIWKQDSVPRYSPLSDLDGEKELKIKSVAANELLSASRMPVFNAIWVPPNRLTILAGKAQSYYLLCEIYLSIFSWRGN